MTGSTKIVDGKVVVIHYILRVGDATGEAAIDTRENDEPIAYLHGSDDVTPALAQQLEGRSAGERFTAVVSPEEGFGRRVDDGRETVARSVFPDDIELEVGMEITVEDDEGETTDMYVCEIAGDQVVLDLNHPLAGETLHYEVEIVEVRDPTADERAHGHVHGPGGHHHES